MGQPLEVQILSPAPTMLYSQAITHLNSLSNYARDRKGYNFSLKKIRRFLKGAGNPQRKFLSVHITGSNGKGAVGNFIFSVLKEQGYRVGFFSSPHLISIRERIRASWLNSSTGLFKDIISRKDFANLIDRIVQIEKKNKDKLSFFETLTTVAFLYFAEQKVDLAIIEAGMGGRLDATNVLNPLICVLTPIALEHCQELGNSLTKIAKEKVGIIKRSTCVVSAPQKEEVKKVIERRCKEKDARLFEARENTLLALKVLEKLKPRFLVSQRAIKQGLRNAYWPARLEEISIIKQNKKYQILLDGGHNPAAAEFLKKAIEKRFPSAEIVLIFSACRDKDIEGMSRVIFPTCKKIIFTRFKNQRCETIRRLRERTGYWGEETKDVREALTLAQRDASANTLILISGSFYLAREAKRNV